MVSQNHFGLKFGFEPPKANFTKYRQKDVLVSKGGESIYDDDRDRFDDPPQYRGGYRGSRRGRGSRGGYRGYNDQMRGNRRGNKRGLQGKMERMPNYHLQEKFKDEFDFSKHELQKEEAKNEDEKEAQEETEKTENVENEEKEDEGNQEEQVKVSSSVGEGFFDDFSNSNLKEENERGRGDR